MLWPYIPDSEIALSLSGVTCRTCPLSSKVCFWLPLPVLWSGDSEVVEEKLAWHDKTRSTGVR